MARTDHDEPAACTLTPNEQTSRRDRWLRLAEVALVGKAATEAGVELRYRARPEVLAELTELADLEAACCGFAEWKVTEGSDTIRLEVVTGPTTAPMLWTMFDESGGHRDRDVTPRMTPGPPCLAARSSPRASLTLKLASEISIIDRRCE